MTWVQWCFEYAALQRKETDEAERDAQMLKASLTAMRNLLIGLLGLNLVPDAPPDAKPGAAATAGAVDGPPDAAPKYVPLSLLCGQPEVIQHYLEKAEKAARESDAAKDQDFDAFSRQLQKQLETGQSDLPPNFVPLLTEEIKDLPMKLWNSPERQAALRALGVKFKPAPAAGTVPHKKVVVDHRRAVPRVSFDPEIFAEVEAVNQQAREDRARRLAEAQAAFGSLDDGAGGAGGGAG